MTGYIKVSLGMLINEIGEDEAKKILSNFSCKVSNLVHNKDVERFLHNKAIIFEQQQLSKTQLIFCSYKKNIVLVAYYTLSSKSFNITKAALSKSLRKKIAKFATYDPLLKIHTLPAPLIAQLGKNYNNNYNTLITGDEVLKMACDDIRTTQSIVGGKVAYLECEDNPKLLDFYGRNGFVQFSKRNLDNDETDIKGEYLVQMLKVFKSNYPPYT